MVRPVRIENGSVSVSKFVSNQKNQQSKLNTDISDAKKRGSYGFSLVKIYSISLISLHSVPIRSIFSILKELKDRGTQNIL